ncbi:MAG: PAS domain S-box protein [Methanoregula sp.]|jgi:PAS domain S-box-containing protein|uniref:PAS domain-containing protein n=1 Tax=Methanoregula sp. TaxID=2052170 RepID=UPI003D0ED4FB
MGNSPGITPFYQRLFVVFIATFAIMSVYELGGGYLVPTNPDWRSGTVTILFTSIMAVVIVYFPLRATYRENERTQSEMERRVAIEDELRKSETKFREIFNSANDAVFIHELSPEGPGKFLDVNDQLCTLLGYTREEMLAMSIPDIDAPGQDVNFPGIVSKLFTEGKVVFQIEHLAKDGRRIPVEVSDRLIRSDGNPVVLAIVRDISERRRFEQDLSFRNTLLAAQQEATLDAILIVDENQKIFSFNNRFLEMAAIPRDIAEKGDDAAMMELTLKKVADPVQFLAKVRYLENDHPGETSRDEIVFRDGRIFDRYSAPMFGPGHRYYGRIWYFRDITDVKTAEKTLRESQEKYKELFELGNEAIFLIETDSLHLVEANAEASAMYGYTHDELLSMLITDLSAEPDETRGVIQNCLPYGSKFTPLRYHRKKDGTVFPVEIMGRSFTLKGKDVHVAAIRDITDRRAAEEALQDSELKFRGIFHAANDAIHFHEVGDDWTPGRFIDLNEAACRLVGYTREEFLGKGPLDFSTGYHSRPFADILRDYETVGRSTFETEQRRKDGSVVPVEINANVITYRGKKSILAILRDITERKQILMALQRANEKLNLMNSITRHDILNKLTAVRGYLGLIEPVITDAKHAGYLRNVDDAVSAIESQIEFTRIYQDLGVQGPRWQNVEKTIRQAVIQLDLGKVTISCSVADLELYADPLLERAFYNLADNAVRYGGTIHEIRVRSETPDESLVLILEDDGIGIPAHEKSVIFNRGFGKNTGLGLFLVREILALTGMTISETGEPGKGARFEIVVPKEAYRFDGIAG